MKGGNIEKAEAVAAKIGSIITRYNATSLSHIDPRSGTKAIWDEVRRLTKSPKHCTIPEALTPQILNAHYSNISTDSSYSAPAFKHYPLPCSSPVAEWEVFRLLDTLTPTATGTDSIPSWFLRVAAPAFSRPLTHLINISLANGIVPIQWKSAVIHPIPKIPSPTLPSDLRPISVVPVLSRLTERLVVRNFLTPALTHLPSHLDITNQFAYRPTSSTTAALISLFSCITDLLETNPYVYCLSFDYSKAFDTLSYSSVCSKLTEIQIPDYCYNWIVSYLTNRTHTTRLGPVSSDPLPITASIVQGSVLGPTLFNINSSELKPFSPHNYYFKYADDAYLIVPSSNKSSIHQELQHHAAWASKCNLKLNPLKTAEIVFSRRNVKEPEVNPGVQRVTSLKILGVTVDNKLKFTEHINSTIVACTQSLFAFRTMRQHGMADNCLKLVFKSTVMSKLLYAVPSFWGFLSSSSRERFEAFLRRAIKLGYYQPNDPDIPTTILKIEEKLFNSIINNPEHVLHPMLPSQKKVPYNLRSSGPKFTLPRKDDRNFLNRMLYHDIY